MNYDVSLEGVVLDIARFKRMQDTGTAPGSEDRVKYFSAKAEVYSIASTFVEDEEQRKALFEISRNYSRRKLREILNRMVYSSEDRDEDRSVIKKFRRVLKDGGRIFPREFSDYNLSVSRRYIDAARRSKKDWLFDCLFNKAHEHYVLGIFGPWESVSGYLKNTFPS